MTALLHITSLELIIARRNLWVATAVGLMVMFSIVLATAGSVSADSLKVDRLAVTVASLTTLSVYLVPLVALLLSFDAIAGERERGTLALLLCYPISRATLLVGKFLAHLLILALAIGAGFMAAGLLAAWQGGASSASIAALVRLFASAVVLGATFLGAGYLISAASRQASTAAGLVIGLWMVCVVLYDLALLGMLVTDDGGVFTRDIFPWLLVANPADAFRTFNLLDSGVKELASGLNGVQDATPRWVPLASLLAWPGLVLTLAWAELRRVEP